MLKKKQTIKLKEIEKRKKVMKALQGHQKLV
jgi:hypothetical protein